MIDEATGSVFQQHCQRHSPRKQGHIIHEFLEEEFDSYDDLVFEEDIYGDGEYLGRYDCLDEKTGHLYEFKTKNDLGMKIAPIDEDIEQIERYLKGLDGDTGFLVYINRDGFETDQYAVNNGSVYDVTEY